jgi:hypothetical protein
MYYVLKKNKYSDESQNHFDTDYHANKAYKTHSEAISKVVALNSLNDHKHISFIIVKDLI